MINLRDYQLGIVTEESKRDALLVVAPMGSGKTISTNVAIGLEVFTKPDIKNVLIIAPKRVAMSVWVQENEKYSMGLNMRFCLRALDIKLFLSEPDSHHVCVCSVTRISEIPHGCWDWIISDESTLFGNKSSKRSWHMRRLCTKNITPKLKGLPEYWPLADHRVKKKTLLTGTPIHGGYEKLWHQIFLLDGGSALGTSLTSFRENFMRVKYQMAGVTTVYEMREELIPRLWRAISHLVYIVRANVKLPPILYKDIPINLPDKRLKEYAIFENESVLRFREETGTNALDGSVKSLVTFAQSAHGSKLRQLASGCVYVDESKDKYSVTHTEKIEAVKEILDYYDGGILIAYNFTSEYKEVCKHFPFARKLETSADIADWNAGKIRIAIGHSMSLGHGLNLQFGGSTILWYSPTYDAELYAQFCARVARSGQVNPVSILHFITFGTIDEKINKVLNKKILTANEFLKNE